jgi:hypothetical protein
MVRCSNSSLIQVLVLVLAAEVKEEMEVLEATVEDLTCLHR